MRSLALSTVGEFEKERTRLGPKSDFFLAWEIGCVAWERVKTCKSMCHTAKPWELDAYLIIYIGWPDVLFSPDMSSFRDLKNASGRDSKNVRDFASSDICVSLGLSQNSYYALTSFGKGISWLNYTTATASGRAVASTDSFWFIVPQGLYVLQSNSPPEH